MAKQTHFIKIFDERLASALRDGGFSYTQEKMNGNQTVYCFCETKKLMKTIRRFIKEWNCENIVIVRDCTLHF